MERFDINETFNWIDENNQKYPEFTSWLKNYCQKKDVDISKEGNFFAITNTLTFPWPRESSRQMTDVEILIFFTRLKAAWHRKLGRNGVKHLNLVLPDKIYNEVERTARSHRETMQNFVLDMIKFQLPVLKLETNDKATAVRKAHQYAAKQNKKYKEIIKELKDQSDHWRKAYLEVMEKLDKIDEAKKDPAPEPQAAANKKKSATQPKVSERKIAGLESSFPSTEDGVADHISKPRRSPRD